MCIFMCLSTVCKYMHLDCELQSLLQSISVCNYMFSSLIQSSVRQLLEDNEF